MKRILLILLAGLFPLTTQAQWETKNPTEFQNELNEWYKNEETSPFQDATLRSKIEGLNYFPIKKKYKINATFHKIENGAIKKYSTSANTFREMQEYGYVEFTKKGKSVRLVVLENLTKYDPEFADYLTIPFYDKTNKNSTYGGGRYLGVWKNDLKDNEPILLNFNLAYQPYCAYVNGYACLIPPKVNTIPFSVKAGVKNGIKGLELAY